MQDAVSAPTALSHTASHCSLLDHLEAEQRAVSDLVLELERHRLPLLLEPGTDAEIARIDRHIARHSHRLDQLGEIEQALLTTPDEQDHPMTRTIQGEAAYRARCTAITESNEGKMNMTLASHLALKTNLSADAAIETMRIAAGNVSRSEFGHLNDNPAAGVAIATAIARGTAR